MKKNLVSLVSCGALLAVFAVSGCAPEEPPRSVLVFEGDEIALEDKLVFCRKIGSKAIEDAECRHARIAASRLDAADEILRRARLEAQSQRKLRALRAAREVETQAQEQHVIELRELAEQKLANGEMLNPEEAEALGIDPSDSILVGPQTLDNNLGSAENASELSEQPDPTDE